MSRLLIFSVLIVASFLIFLCHMSTNTLAVNIEADVTKRVRPLIISCIGDSITNGSSVNSTSSYPAFLQNHFDSKLFQVLKFGSNGATVLRVSEKPFWLESEFLTSMASIPNYIILQFGTNDAKEGTWNESTFKSEYIDLIEQYQSLTSRPSIVLSTPPPISCPQKTRKNEKDNNCWAYSFRSHVVNNLLPKIISDIAYRTGSGLVDNFNYLGGVKLSRPDAFFEEGKLKEEEWTNKHPYDGIHPNTLGNQLIADNVAWKLIEIIHRNEKINKAYKLNKVIDGGLHQMQNYLLISNTIESRNKIQHDAVYPAIYSHMHDYPKINASNMPIRPVLACVGDSLTRGLRATDTETTSYPAVLSRHPGFHHYQVMNFGRDSASLKKGDDLNYRTQPAYRAAIRSYPHIVVIQFGTNDAMTENLWNETNFTDNYLELINDFKKLSSQPTIYLNIPGPIYSNRSNSDEKFIDIINIDLPIVIRKIAALSDSTVIDLYNVLGGAELKYPETMSDDDVHPNDYGYIKIAHEVAFTISNNENFTILHHHNKHSSFHNS